MDSARVQFKELDREGILLNHSWPVAGVLLAMWITLFSAASAAEKIIEPQILKELHEKAVPAWQRIEEGFRSIEITFEETYESGPVGHMKTGGPTTFQLAYDADRKLTLLRTQTDKSSSQMSHDVANSRYEFEVLTPVMTEKGKLMNVHIGESPDDEDRLDGRRYASKLAACTIRARVSGIYEGGVSTA